MSEQVVREGEASEPTMPLLGAISAFLRWVEELVVLLSGPMLTVGLGIGLVSLLSDGKLLVDAPWLLYAWAVAQAVGVDGQIVGVWYRVSVAVSQRRWGVMLAFGLLGTGAGLCRLHRGVGLRPARGLWHLHCGGVVTAWGWIAPRGCGSGRRSRCFWCVCRAICATVRHEQDTRSLEEKKRELREQMELDALRQEQRAQQASGLATLVRSTVAAARGSQEHADAAGTAEDAPVAVASEETAARPFAEARR